MPTDLSGSTTSVTNHRRFGAYGDLLSESNNAVDMVFAFTGKLQDENTKLQNNLNRWYDAAIGQWMSEDPIGFQAGDGNVRRYVANRITLATDPMGLQSIDDGTPPIKAVKDAVKPLIKILTTDERKALIMEEVLNMIGADGNVINPIRTPNPVKPIRDLKDIFGPLPGGFPPPRPPVRNPFFPIIKGPNISGTRYPNGDMPNISPFPGLVPFYPKAIEVELIWER